MPGRSYSQTNGSYRYSINGQEKTPEIAPNTTTAEFWQYDARIVRRWNVDPKSNVSITPYASFENNPIWYSDFKGDSIGPNRTTAYNVFVAGKTRDIGSKLSFARLKETQQKNPNSIIIETDKLNGTVADEITKRLGTKGYVGTMVVDYHRSDYDDNMNVSEKDLFFKKLSEGYAGDKTNVLLGMCWAGGGPTFKNKDHPDLTLNISKKLDKAVVYGLNTEASNLPFYTRGDFGVLNLAYLFSNDRVAKNEKANESLWTISRYSPVLKQYSSEKVHEMIILNLEGKIIRNKYKTKSYPVPSFGQGRRIL